jgi:DNA adenine methylase
VKWHGGKDALATRIVGLFPPRCKNPNKPADSDKGYLHYVEPYAGGCSVLLANDPEGISEVIGDTNHDLMSFWQVLRDPRDFKEFKRACDATDFNEATYTDATDFNEATYTVPHNALSGYRLGVRAAWRFFVKCRMSLAGRNDAFTGITRMRTRRGMNAEVSAWLNVIEGLPLVHARLKRVMTRLGPALRLIESEDGPRTLFYLDPPYLHETRATTTEYGEHEMTPEQHEELLKRLAKIEGRFLLSGYRSKLYDTYAKRHGWYRVEFKIKNSAAGGKKKRTMTECVWSNYPMAV